MDQEIEGVYSRGSNESQTSKEHEKITLEIESHLDVGFLISYFIVLILVQNIYFAYKDKNYVFQKLRERIAFNEENRENIEDLIKTELQAKLNLLKTKENEAGMPYEKWVNHINKDPFIYYPTNKDMKYWIQSWKVIPNTNNENYHLRIYPDNDFMYHTWADMLNSQSQKFISQHIEADKQLIKKWFLLNDKPFSIFQFYTYDPVFDANVERKSVIYRFDDGEGNAGTISSGYTVSNLNEKFSYDHLKGEGRQLYFLTILVTLFLSFFIFAINSRYKKTAIFKSIIFFTIIMVYITLYFSSYDEYGTFDIEKEKLNNINQGILSMSFMSGISIFILNKIRGDNRRHLYYETSFFLIIVMFTTIGSLFKNNQYVKPEEITKIRSTKEFIFNYSLMVNLFIIINFGINVMT